MPFALHLHHLGHRYAGPEIAHWVHGQLSVNQLLKALVQLLVQGHHRLLVNHALKINIHEGRHLLRCVILLRGMSHHDRPLHWKFVV